MRKIYSLVLLAAALLVGTNAWAVDVVGNDRAALQSAINGVTGKQTVTLTLQNNITLDGPIWLGTEYLTDTQDDYAKSIILDLNGHSIAMVGNGGTCNMFVLTRGELLVRNSSATESQIILSGSSNSSSQIFSVYGSYRSSRWNADGTSQDGADSINTRTRGYVSHLEIGERVKIIAAANCLGAGIVVDALFADKISCAGWAAATYYSKTLHYFTNVFGSNHGFAYGVRVDLYGDIEMIGISSGTNKAYGIKVNGCVRSPKETQENKPLRTLQMDGSTNNYLSNYDARREGHKLDTIDVPFVYVHNTAKVQTNSGSTKSAAIYASGYAKWLIEGHCEGNIGVSVSSGSVEFHDAVVVSTAENYEQPNGGGSVSGSGSAVVVNSRDAYAGDIKVTITGDTKVAADAGYAIEELVKTTADTTKVETITIEGGTIEGGDKGAIIVSEKTVTNPATDVTVYGGNFSGNVAAGTGTITDILPDGGSSTTAHVTTVTDPATGKTTIVVSEGAAPNTKTLSEAIADYNAWVSGGKEGDAPSVKIDEVINTSLSQSLIFKELELNSANSQQLTIPENMTLTVGRMVLGANAIIFIEPGAKLIVDGEQGIVSPVVTNLILRVREDKQGSLLFNPAVSSNRQPYATVQLYTTAYQMDDNNYSWHRFTSPMAEMTDMTYTMGGRTTHGGASFFTSISEWDYVNNTWSTPLPSVMQMKPFVMYDMTNNATTAGVRYNFKGRIQGTVTDVLNLSSSSWNYYGNAYTGTMNIKAMFDYMGNDNVEKTVYVWDNNNNSYTTITYAQIEAHMAAFDTVATLKTLVFRLKPNTSITEGKVKLDYKKSVWEYMTKTGDFAPTSSAPQRTISDFTSVRISVTAEDGSSDCVTLIEKDSYSNEYESGADAYKLMNENHINFYAVTDINQAVVATDNMSGTMLSLQTMDEVNYTLSFDKVNGEVYALRDNLTNTVVVMNEGATYNFMAQSNATLDGRFQIISRQEMPTAVETVEETVNAPKAIYTVMGQYVGETTNWNNLPAGVYVVDGVKIVK